MKLINNPDRSQWAEILKRPVMNTENLFDTVRGIIDRVKSDGDRAVLEMEAKFDKAELTSLAVTEAELKEAETLVDEKLKAAIRLAKQNIETFHAVQRFEGKKVGALSIVKFISPIAISFWNVPNNSFTSLALAMEKFFWNCSFSSSRL